MIAKSNRLGATFHRTFSLRRNQVRDVLELAYQSDTLEKITWNRNDLRETTSIGTRQAESAPRYAYGMGLIDEKNKLTLFGKFAFERDPTLARRSTQWLLHYYLSASDGFGPFYWHEIVQTRFRTGNRLQKDSMADQIADIIQQTEGRRLELRYAKSCANILLKTYTDFDGLSALGILEEKDGLYLVQDPDPPPAWVVAVALLDLWQTQYADRITINLDRLYAAGGLTSIFMMGEGRLNRHLLTMQEAGLIDVYRVAPPYQVALLNADMAFALNKLYTDDDTD